MARNITVYFADGSRHEYRGVPDSASPEQVAARAARDFQGKQIRHLERAPASEPEPERTLGGYAKEAFKGLVPGLVGLGETAITGAAALLPEEAEQAVRRPVEEFAAGVRETFAPAAGYEDTAVRKISEAVGSTLPFLPLGALGLAGRAAATGLGVAAGAGEARGRAEEAEATESERGLATALGTIPGALESLPPIRILRRFGFGDEAVKEVAGFAPALRRAAQAGGEEALQEASSQVLQNLIAKGVYAPDEAVFGGVGEAAALGGGAGAVVSAIADLALGRRLRGPEAEPTEEAPPEEPTEPEITPEQLAPKGAPTRAAPIRAKTLEELQGFIPPAAPKAEEEVAAPAEPREVKTYEQVKPPEPEAVQEAADFVAQFEGTEKFNLFKARSIARKLGYEGITNKTTRAEVEPLLRQAVTPVEEIAVPETAVLPTVEAPPVDVLAGKEIRPPSDDIYEVADSNFLYPRMVGNQVIPIEEIAGGVTAQPNELARVEKLANEIASEDGYFSRIIVDQDNTVLEGQHRLEALRKLGVEKVPVYKIENMEATFPVIKMQNAVKDTQPMHPDQARQIVGHALEAISKTGSVEEAAKLYIPGYQKAYLAALEVAESVAPKAEVPSEPIRPSVAEAVTGTAPRGIELPVPRERPAGPEVAAPPIARLEPISVAAPRVAEGKAVEPAALEDDSDSALMSRSIAEFLRGKAVKTRKLPSGNTLVTMPTASGSKGSFTPDIEIPSGIDVTPENAAREALVALRNRYTRDGKEFPTNPKQMSRDEFVIAYNAGAVPEFEIQGEELGTIVKDTGAGTAFTVDADALYDKIQSQAAPTEQRFLSLDDLNRTTPALPEQTRERAPSLRRELGKSIAQYDAGELTGDDVANRAGMLLLQTQKERMVMPRQRGPEFVRERLMNASRNGELDPQGVEIASWFIQQNPVLANDLAISIRQRPEEMQGTAAFYNPVNRMVTLFKDAGDERTAVHEILHHTERLMPTNIRAGLLKAYTRQLLKAQKKAKTAEEKAFFKAVVDEQLGEGTPAAYKDALDAIKNARINKSYYQYVNPSEFWAVNASRIVQNRYGVPPTVTGQLKRWLREFLEKVKSALGLSSDAAAIRALDSLVKADGKYKTEAMLALAPEYLSVEPTKKAKPIKPKKSLAELRREATDKQVQPGVVKQVVQKLTGPSTSFETVAKNFQNVNRKVKKIQDDVKQAGRLEYVGEGKTNIDDQMSAAANRASYVVATEVEPVVRRLKESMLAYAKATNTTLKNALDKVDSYLIALHEPERRETKYLRNVPLNNTVKLEFIPGEGPMTPADARAALETRRSLAQNKEQAEAIQDMMRYLAANYADSRGYSPVKARLEESGKPTPEEMTTDFYDPIYDVIGPEYTQEELESAREEYENLDEADKAMIDQIRQDLVAVHELNKNLNRRANYWTDKVDRVIESYGWKNYVPFKGSPRADKTLDTDTEYLSGELSQAPESFEGRRSNFDSPILQTISESYFAASRAGRGTDVTQTIKNLINLGVIKTKNKRPKVFTFEERNAPDFDYNEVRGRDKVLHYNEDGSVEVFKIEDPEVLEAIKTPFKEMNWATKMGNKLTSTLGQLHTRYNPAFPPMDFIRNSLTNASLIAAREGGAKAREYIAAVAANVARNGLWKSGKLSKLLAENNTAQLARLAKESPFYRDAIDMMKYGGRTMYRMSFNISDTMEELSKELGPKKIISDPSQFMKYIDAYNDAFELTSRVGAFTVRKDQNIAEAKKRGLNVNDPKVMEDINKEAAAFALSLMDFRKIGKYGRELGAWFMFIRPAATGAVDAIDALRPAFQTPQKIYDRLEPEVKELFETNTLVEEIRRIEKNKRPDKKKIAALQQEIARREKAFEDFESEQNKRIRNAKIVGATYVAMGAALYGMAAAISGEDDEGRNRVETDDMSRWTRYLRLPIIGGEGFFQVPWGFGISGLMSFGAQAAALARGNSSFKDFAGNTVEIAVDSFLPIPASRINPFENFGAWMLDSATPSAARPVVEYVLNIDAMGNPIYNSRTGKYADAYSGSTRPSEIHRAAAQYVFDTTNGKIDPSPDTIAFFLNNYADAINHLAENAWNLALTATGDKDFDAKKDTFVLRSFIGRNSNYDAREFAEAEKEIKDLSRRLKTIEDFGSPEQILRFYREQPNADILIQTYNAGVNGELRRLQTESNQIKRDRTLTPKQRKELLDDIQVSMNYIKKGLVEDFKAYDGR